MLFYFYFQMLFGRNLINVESYFKYEEQVELASVCLEIIRY